MAIRIAAGTITATINMIVIATVKKTHVRTIFPAALIA